MSFKYGSNPKHCSKIKVGGIITERPVYVYRVDKRKSTQLFVLKATLPRKPCWIYLP